MRSRVSAVSGKRILKLIAAGLLAGASAACSDSGRFASNPFTNPFASAPTSRVEAPKVDRITTGTAATRAAPLGVVAAQPLPSPLPSAAAVATPRVASRTLQSASPIGGSAAGWTAAGGTPVTVGPGETAATLSARYGVPVAAISAANGGVIQPGRQAIIPVYSGGGQPKAGLMQPQTQASAAPAPRPAAAPAASGDAGPASNEQPQASTTARRTSTAPLPLQRPPQAQPTLKQAAKPTAAAKVAKADDDDDEDEDEAPKRIIAAAPKQGQQPAPKPTKQPQAAAPRPAQPAPQQQAQAQPRPQVRVIPTAPQEPPKQQVAEAPKSDPVTTNSIPQTLRPVEPSEPKADFRWPARGRIISGFGAKGGNGDGIAIAVPEGTPVKAAEGGTVAYAGEELKGYGKLVLVRHDNGYVTAYAHNGELNVKRGDKVARGQTIAKSGATGNVTSPQLHFELRRGSTPVDPTKYLEN